MEDACSSASLREQRCQVVGQKQASGAELLVSVAWVDEAKQSARIDVRRGPGARRARTLSFAPQDPELERWRSVGFAIATLVGEVEDDDEVLATSSPMTAKTSTVGQDKKRERDAQAPRTKTPLHTTFGGVGLRALGGLDGALLMGIEARAGRQLGGFLGVSLAAGTTLLGEGSPQDVRGGLTWLAAGVFAPLLRAEQGAVGLRAEVLAEQLSTEAERGWQHDARHHWRPATRVALDGELPLGAWLSLEASVELGLRAGETRVFVADEPSVTLPVLRPGAGGGVMARF